MCEGNVPLYVSYLEARAPRGLRLQRPQQDLQFLRGPCSRTQLNPLVRQNAQGIYFGLMRPLARSTRIVTGMPVGVSSLCHWSCH